MEKKHYSYEGPITEFDTVLSYRWKGETWAVSPQKARSNLAYQVKKEYKRLANCRIELPGRLQEIV